MKRFLSSPFFLIALIAFFLPFFLVTCGGGLGDLGGLGGDVARQEREVTGLELITGQAEEKFAEAPAEPEAPGIPGVGPTPTIPGIPAPPAAGGDVDLGMAQIWAIAAAAVALVGIFLALIAGRPGGAIALVLGAAGAALLFVLRSEFESAIVTALGGEAEGLIDVQERVGYWIALGGFVVAGVTGLVRLLLPDRPALAPPAGFGTSGAPPPAPPPGPPPAGPPPAGPPPPSEAP